MTGMDIFNNDAFRTRELSDAIQLIPNQWGRIGELGIFMPKGIRTPQFMVESKNGVLQLIQSSERGTNLPSQKRGKRNLRGFSTVRFGLESQITADDIAGIRAFGSETELKQVMDEVADRQVELRGSIDITREYLRAGALQGVVKDADGSVLLDLFDAFDITQKEVDFDLGTQGSNLPAKCAEVVRHVKRNLKGDVMTGVMAFVTPTRWDQLMFHDEFKEAWKYYQDTVQPLRDDVSGGFKWKGIYWEEYEADAEVPQEDGTTIQQSFIPEGDIRFFPVGTRNTFRQYNAPADYLETVNTKGQDFYSKVMPDPKANRFVDVEAQMNTLPMSQRPGVLVRGHSST